MKTTLIPRRVTAAAMMTPSAVVHIRGAYGGRSCLRVLGA